MSLSTAWKLASGRQKKFAIGAGGAGLFVIFLILSSIAAWVTHVIITIKTAAWVLLVVGAIFFPIGVIHGWMVWFGLT